MVSGGRQNVIRGISRLPREEFAARRYGVTKTPYFSIKTKKNKGESRRLGVVAGKSAAKTATERNFLKREARGALRDIILPGMDVLVIFFSGAKELTKRRLWEVLRETATRAQS